MKQYKITRNLNKNRNQKKLSVADKRRKLGTQKLMQSIAAASASLKFNNSKNQ